MPAEHHPMNDTHRLFLDTLTRYERPLLRYAHSYTNDAEEARDVVQDVFVKLSQNLATLDAERLAPWLFTVCKNRALDHQRKHQRITVMDMQTLDLEVSETPQPGDEMQTRETAAALRGLIDELPLRQREAIRLKFIAGLDYKQISDAMQTSIGNVGYLIHHGVQALRLKWQEMEGDIPAKPKTAIA
ncbi:RNA polymerase sigma-70 factor (ECF subfamily) [Prosthecobacter fusiformis]|uniref:RNA polymerase sigma-70 factor (ECF subfamily) n=2 Tax=Prosthecobacter fusiformis TaxID=48464 RepID=A0A4R7S3Q8_9BACT|nr:RNA polymerase sigma-70 factor (ECF subfamily) [Prosthecobacter fusiformis]